MRNILPFSSPKSNTLDQESALDIVHLAEQVLIQSLISFPTCLQEFGITAEFFSQKYFRLACMMIVRQHEKGAPVSLELLKAAYHTEFLDAEFGLFFDELWQGRSRQVNSHLPYYVGVIKEAHFKNSFETLKILPPKGETVVQQVEHLIDSAKTLLDKNVEAEGASFDEDWCKVLQIAEDAKEGILPHSLKTHYPSLDGLIGEGILDDYLVVVGADSGAGKTTFALNLIRNVAMHHKHATLYLSFEMGRTRLMRWFISACTNIPIASFINGKLTDAEINIAGNFRNSLCKDALLVVETHPELANVLAAIRFHIKRNPHVRMIVIDHLHLMHWSKSVNSTEAVSAITKALKQLTMELQVPIILLSQLTKPHPDFIKGDPHISRLKGSGSIITDADLIMILQVDSANKMLDDNIRVVRNYVLKNRGGRADGAYVSFGHYIDRCVMKST